MVNHAGQVRALLPAHFIETILDALSAMGIGGFPVPMQSYTDDDFCSVFPIKGDFLLPNHIRFPSSNTVSPGYAPVGDS